MTAAGVEWAGSGAGVVRMEVYSFGLGVGLACLIGGAAGSAHARRRGVGRDDWWRLVTGLMVVGMIGGRLVHVLPDAGYYLAYPYEIIRPPVEGFSYYGAILAGALYVHRFARRRDLGFGQVADLLALPWLVALLFIALLWGAPVAKAGAPAGVRLFFDVLYLTAIYVLLAWVRRQLRRPGGHGRLLVAVLAVDGLLRLISGLVFTLYLPATFDVPAADHISRGIAFAAGAALLWLTRGAATGAPQWEAGRHPISRWKGWLVTYVVLVVIRIVAGA